MERDRYPDALAVAARAVDVAPNSPDVINTVAGLHQLLGHGDEALATLRSGAARTQSAAVTLGLVAMLDERKLFDERHAWIERWVALVPLLEAPERALRLRADSAYDRGDVRAALELLRQDPSALSQRVADRIERTLDAPEASVKRVLLDVPFVRQHHMTCAPATLSALAGYWEMEAAHLEIAEAICYDGHPAGHSQRTWAEEHGFVAREMTVTWDVARALLDRGVPITVAIVEGGGAHLQAIVGYDERRGTLFLRDPFVPHRLEALAEEWLATWRATGPAGMGLVPVGEEWRFDGIELPDAALCDTHHRLQAALGRHDRGAAERACRELVATAPGHRLAIAARRALAAYDEDAEGVLACARETSALFPAFVPARLDALLCMRAVRSRDERIAAAEELLRASGPSPANARNAASVNGEEALYAEVLAASLAEDARQHPAAARLLRRAHRTRPDRHGPLSLLADIAWDARKLDEAVALRRFAACLGRFDEGAAQAYFAAARATGRAEEALAFLESRVAELGSRAAGPVGTLFRALEAMGRTDEGLAAVSASLARRPHDGDLSSFSPPRPGGRPVRSPRRASSSRRPRASQSKPTGCEARRSWLFAKVPSPKERRSSSGSSRASRSTWGRTSRTPRRSPRATGRRRREPTWKEPGRGRRTFDGSRTSTSSRFEGRGRRRPSSPHATSSPSIRPTTGSCGSWRIASCSRGKSRRRGVRSRSQPPSRRRTRRSSARAGFSSGGRGRPRRRGLPSRARSSSTRIAPSPSTSSSPPRAAPTSGSERSRRSRGSCTRAA